MCTLAVADAFASTGVAQDQPHELQVARHLSRSKSAGDGICLLVPGACNMQKIKGAMVQGKSTTARCQAATGPALDSSGVREASSGVSSLKK